MAFSKNTSRLNALGLFLAAILTPTKLLVRATPAYSSCIDDMTFRYQDEGDKDCGWVGRNAIRRCERTTEDGTPLKVHCPWVCNECDDYDDEDDDDDDYDDDAASSLCHDDPDFRFNLEEKKSCVWVGTNPTNRCVRNWKGRMVADYCPEICGLCPETEDRFDDGLCRDDEDFLYRNNPNRNCDWVARDTDLYCHEHHWLGKPLSYFCPVTCDTCPEEDDRSEEEEEFSGDISDEEPGTEGCCSLNYKECIGWCGSTKDSCLDCNHHDGVAWLDNGPPQEECKKRWSGCFYNPNSCCAGLECRPDRNNYMACLPPLSVEEDEEMIEEEVPVERDEDEGEDGNGCCSLDYKQCIGWCGSTKDSCLECNHHDGVGWLRDGPPQNSQCKPRWTGCSGSPNSCCPGLVCRENENNWMACLPVFE